MSRSYRRPFAAITGTASAKDDKRLAHRGLRRKQNLALKICPDLGNLLLPHRFECAWNNNYCWGRDGAQCYLGSMRNSQDCYSQKYYRKILRK
jgi:ribosomal protein L32